VFARGPEAVLLDAVPINKTPHSILLAIDERPHKLPPILIVHMAMPILPIFVKRAVVAFFHLDLVPEARNIPVLEIAVVFIAVGPFERAQACLAVFLIVAVVDGAVGPGHGAWAVLFTLEVAACEVRIVVPRLLSPPMLQIVDPLPFILAVLLLIDKTPHSAHHIINKASLIRALLRHHRSLPIRRVILELPRKVAPLRPVHLPVPVAHPAPHPPHIYRARLVSVLYVAEFGLWVVQGGEAFGRREEGLVHLEFGLTKSKAAEPASDHALKFDCGKELAVQLSNRRNNSSDDWSFACCMEGVEADIDQLVFILRFGAWIAGDISHF